MLWSLLLLVNAVLLATSQASYPESMRPVDDELTWGGVPGLLRQGWLHTYSADKDSDPADTELPEQSKRALSMLGRWRPFSNFMSRYVQPRVPVLPPNTDFVSAETRGAMRPYGQPLRWGRR